jgi:acetyltransferase-like isoleucine patch superfamily enzyme
MPDQNEPQSGCFISHDTFDEPVAPQIFEPTVFINSARIIVSESARIDSFVKIEGGQGVKIGRWVHIASFCHLNIGGGKLIFEEGSAASSGVKIVTGSNSREGLSFSAAAPKEQQVIKKSKVVIKKNAILFTNAVISPGVTVGEGAEVWPGAVVTHDVGAYEIWAGVPARKIGERARP